MSVSSVMLLVGATTLVAALVTLCAFQTNAAKLERRINRRSRTLEGLVPGHRSLSSIGLNAEASRRESHVSRPESPESSRVSVALDNDSKQEDRPSASVVGESPSPVRETKLNALHTIQARSAALQDDDRQTKPAMTKLSMLGEGVGERRSQSSDPEPAQGLVARRSRNGADDPGSTESVPSAPDEDPATQTVDGQTDSSDHTKRPSTEGERSDSPQPVCDEARFDAPGDGVDPDAVSVLQQDGVGAQVSQDHGVPDILAQLKEMETAAEGLEDDLSDIDGGGLPGLPQKMPQK